MAKKISELLEITTLATADLIEVSQAAGGGVYASKKINLVKNAANVRSALGAGDMLKTVYDINNNEIVDEAKKAEMIDGGTWS